MTVWVTGAAGMLGTEVVLAFGNSGVTLLASDLEVDITSQSTVSEFWDRAGKIDWVVNCAAWTAVDKAEAEEDAAYALNATGPKVLAAESAVRGAAMVHISTDYVFDGQSDRPYRPEDIPAPNSAYGMTKLAGETMVRESLSRHVIIRTAWLYGTWGPNFVYTMVRLMCHRDSIDVVADQLGTPTYAFDLAETITTIVTAPTPSYGIYHFTNAGQTTWHEFASVIYQEAKSIGIVSKNCRINAITTNQYPTPARRPAYSVLDTSALISTYGISIPDWRESLHVFMEKTFRWRDDLRNLAGHAQYDLETAAAMLDARRYLYVGYTCQQAVEKNLKVLAALHYRAPYIHDPLRLADSVPISFSEEERRLFADLAGLYIRGRYCTSIDDLSAVMSERRAHRLFQEARTLCERLRRHPIFSLW